MTLSLLTLVGPSSCCWSGRAPSSERLRPPATVVIDGPTVFFQGTILILAFLSFLLFAERERRLSR